MKWAIDAGYRLIDTAWAYENEAEIGKAVRAKINQGVIKRKDIFIVTKVVRVPKNIIILYARAADKHSVNKTLSFPFVFCSA